MSYKSYVTPEYYLDQYEGGIVPEEELAKALKQASRHIDSLTYNRIAGRGFSNLTSFQQELIRDGMTRYRQMVCRLSNGRKEDALFYYCTLIQSLEEILSGKGAKVSFPKHQELLEKGRS